MQPEFTTMQMIVEAAGGRMLRREPDSPFVAGGRLRCIIVSCEADLLMCTKYSGKNIGVFSPELILTGVLLQQLEFDKFTLEIPTTN